MRRRLRNASYEDVGESVRGQKGLVQGEGRGQGHRADDRSHFVRCAPELVGIGGNDLADGLGQRGLTLTLALLVAGLIMIIWYVPPQAVQGGEDAAHVGVLFAHQLQHGGNALGEVQLGIDRRDRRDQGLGIDDVLDQRAHQLVLVGEDAEEGALGEACGFGDLARGDGGTPVEDEGDRRLQDVLTALVSGKWFGATHAEQTK